MSPDSISVISVHEIYCENKEHEKKDQYKSCVNVFKTLVVSILGIIMTSTIFVIPWTIIPRSNSIVYQSYWMEVNLPLLTNWIVIAGVEILNLMVWTKEKSVASLLMLIKLFLLNLIPWIVLYTLCYLVWTIHLGFNHPSPWIAYLTYPAYILFMAGLWFVLPANLLSKEDFRRKLRFYMIYVLWDAITIFQNEILSYLFFNLPDHFQFFVAFLVSGCRELDKRVRTKLVGNMMMERDELATALIAITVNSCYAIFAAVRLVAAESATVFCFVAIDLFRHLKITYGIINEYRKIDYVEKNGRQAGQGIKITGLLLAEIIEGVTPVVYAICMAMAYFGPNAYIFSNVRNNYWSQEIEDIMPTFLTMFFLFAFDLLNALINLIFLWKLTKLNVLQAFCRVIDQYWFFIAAIQTLYIINWLTYKDVNLGADETGRNLWITDEGRISLINNSTDLTYEEKAVFSENRSSS